jgi:hypothetical protein
MQVSVESKEVLSDDLGINAPATVTANSNEEDEGVEATKTKTVEELSDLPENSDTSSESDTMNIHDDEELAGREKTKPAVSKIQVSSNKLCYVIYFVRCIGFDGLCCTSCSVPVSPKLQRNWRMPREFAR